ncbi:transposase [Streptomyces albireticuli]|uniref:transposase n=1 Tax=Streptomyces albireticuli TaxID=1940 RepID=UPI0027E2DBC2|nr:transposase [Streptomyces albireticuli]
MNRRNSRGFYFCGSSRNVRRGCLASTRPSFPSLTTGEVQAHLAEVYPTGVYPTEASRQTISTITDKTMGSVAKWQNRPLNPGRFLHRWCSSTPSTRRSGFCRRSCDPDVERLVPSVCDHVLPALVMCS